MLRLVLLLLLALPVTQTLHAQSTTYVSDEVFVVLHRGPGAEYRWVAKLTPGTELQAGERSDDGDWTEVTTTRGTSGWVRSEFLSTQKPAQVLLPDALARAEQMASRNAELSAQLQTLQAERVDMLNRLNSTEGDLGSVAEELANLKQISGKAVQLDEDNRRLVEVSENLRSEVEMLEAENQRLQDKLSNEDFINGALAVLLGVIITLVVPRLWPKRRKNSSWGSSW